MSAQLISVINMRCERVSQDRFADRTDGTNLITTKNSRRPFFGRKEDFAWHSQERSLRKLFKPWSTVYFINELANWYGCWFIIAIILTHYKLKAEGVKQCLMSGTTQLTSDVLRQVLAFAPDDQEVTAV